MNDMGQVIIPRSDQLNADDLITGPKTITIAGVTIRGGQEQPISIHYEGDNDKPYKACKSMCRVMVTAWGADSKQYVGRSMTLYRDPTVKWGGMEVGGIRISHMSDIESKITLALTMTKSNRKPYTVQPLQKAATTGGNASPSGAESTERPSSAAPIDEKQEGIVLDLLTAHGVELSALLAFGEWESLPEMPARYFDKACKWIKAQGKS